MSGVSTSKTFLSKPISIVVPLYKSKAHLNGLEKLLKELSTYLSAQSEVIFINDGDPNQRDVKLFVQFEKLPIEFSLFQLNESKGQMTATLWGISKAKCPLILTMDADTKCKTSVLLDLIGLSESEEQKIGYLDFSLGNDQRSLFRQLLSSVNQLVVKTLTNKNLKGHVGSSTRVFHRSFINQVMSKNLCPELLDITLLRQATEIGFVQTKQEQSQSSSYTINKILNVVFRSILCLILPPKPFSPTEYLYENQTGTR